MQNQLIQMMMGQLKNKNPQMFALINQASQNNTNPMELLKQVTSNYTPEQMQNLLSRAEQFGVPKDVLNKIQNN